MLREWTVEDAQDFYELNADPVVLKYTGDEPFASVLAAEEFIKNYHHYQQHGYGRWAVIMKESDTWIGFCGLRNQDGVVDLGFRLKRVHWGRGLATEAARACLRYGHDGLDIKKIIGSCHPKNQASERVLQKCGMTRIDTPANNGCDWLIYQSIH